MEKQNIINSPHSILGLKNFFPISARSLVDIINSTQLVMSRFPLYVESKGIKYSICFLKTITHEMNEDSVEAIAY